MRATWRRLIATCCAATWFSAACTDRQDEEPPTLSQRMSVSVERGLAADSRYDPVRAVLVTADQEPLVEHYAGTSPEEFHPVMSVTKSVLSTVVGVAADEGLLSVDDTLAELLPGHADRMRPEVAAVTLGDLLSMRGGFIEEEEPRGFDFATAPDATAALAEAVGGSVLAYAREALFDPLGVDSRPAAEPALDPANSPEHLAADFAWPVDRRGLHVGWSLLKLRPGDMLAFGQLILDQGRWRGEQLVSESWCARRRQGRSWSTTRRRTATCGGGPRWPGATRSSRGGRPSPSGSSRRAANRCA